MSEVETTETEEVSNETMAMAILQPHIDAGETDEETLIVALIQEGSFKFGPATRLLKSCLENAGLRIAPKERQAKIDEMLGELDAPFGEWSEVASFAESAAEEIDDTTAGQAIKCIRNFYKKHDVELPAKPKGAKGVPRVNAFDQFGTWLVANRDADGDAVLAFANTITEKEKQAVKYAARFEQIAKIARAYAGE